MSEERAAIKHLTDTLKANSAVAALVGTRVYEGAAPQNAVFPYIVFGMQSAGNDRNQPGGDGRMMSRALWLVKVITQGSPSSGSSVADNINDAVDAALVGSTDVVTINAATYTILSICRTGHFRMIEPAETVRYHHVGGLYRIQVTNRS